VDLAVGRPIAHQEGRKSGRRRRNLRVRFLRPTSLRHRPTDPPPPSLRTVRINRRPTDLTVPIGPGEAGEQNRSPTTVHRVLSPKTVRVSRTPIDLRVPISLEGALARSSWTRCTSRNRRNSRNSRSNSADSSSRNTRSSSAGANSRARTVSSSWSIRSSSNNRNSSACSSSRSSNRNDRGYFKGKEDHSNRKSPADRRRRRPSSSRRIRSPTLTRPTGSMEGGASPGVIPAVLRPSSRCRARICGTKRRVDLEKPTRPKVSGRNSTY